MYKPMSYVDGICKRNVSPSKVYLISWWYVNLWALFPSCSSGGKITLFQEICVIRLETYVGTQKFHFLFHLYLKPKWVHLFQYEISFFATQFSLARTFIHSAYLNYAWKSFMQGDNYPPKVHWRQQTLNIDLPPAIFLVHVTIYHIYSNDFWQGKYSQHRLEKQNKNFPEENCNYPVSVKPQIHID